MSNDSTGQMTVERVECNFCGNSQRQVTKLFGGRGAYICDRCIDLCNWILDEEMPSWPWKSTEPVGADTTQEGPRPVPRGTGDETGTLVTIPPDLEEALARLWETYRHDNDHEALQGLLNPYAPLAAPRREARARPFLPHARDVHQPVGCAVRVRSGTG
jgi:hypothetical protein